MKYLCILILLLCTSIVGCAYHGPLQKLPYVSTADAAELVIIADNSGLVAGQAIIPVIDGREAYSLARNQYVVFNVAPGEHTVLGKMSHAHHQITDRSVLEISAKPKERVYLHFLVNMGIRPDITVSRISEWEAKELMEKAERVGS